jgi:hypothetical protein
MPTLPDRMSDWTAIIALCGALLILTIFALVDAFAVSSCFSLAHSGIGQTELCSPEHLFRSTLEIAGMAIGLFGAVKIVPAFLERKA